jgi:hypothetical protein
VNTPLAALAKEIKFRDESLHEARRFIAKCRAIIGKVSVFTGIVMALKKLMNNRPINQKINIMNQYKNPNWWNEDNDSAWERAKAAFRRDWDQTKHDLGGQEPDTNQKIGNTARQASGNEIIPPRGVSAYEEVEPAYRYGFGARSKYGAEYLEWDDELEMHLKGEWEQIAPARKQTWMQDRAAIRRGWDYTEEDVVETADR